MSPRNTRIAWMMTLLLALAAGRAEASFHLWSISEVYSDADAKVQFVELVCQPFDGENLLGGHTLVAGDGVTTHTFTFPSDINTNTSNKHLLIATAGYAALPTAVTPDFTIPAGFLPLTGGSVNYAEGISIVNYSSLPLNSTSSRNYPGGAAATNTPTNFAGQTGAITNPTIANPLPDIPAGTIAIELQTIVPSTPSPIGIAQPDNTLHNLFLYDQSGVVTAIVDDVVQSTPALDISSRIIFADERGLIGMAFHPDFAHHPQVYTFTSEPTSGTADFTNIDHASVSQTVIAEWTMTGGDPNALTIDPASRRELLRIDKPDTNHNGGGMHFGPDGYLYMAIGDGGNGNDVGTGHAPGGNGQSLDYVYGKLLRIDVDRTTGSLLSANGQYGIPASNPFVGKAGVDEIYAYGFRNPFSFNFDLDRFTTGTFNLYVGDVGQNKIEEVDVLTSATVGGNFGWPVKEGTFYFDNGNVRRLPIGAIPPNIIDPISDYDHDDGSAIIGGALYRGLAIPELHGLYVFGDLSDGSTGRLFYLDANNAPHEFIIGTNDRALGYSLQGISQDRLGELYVMGGGEVDKVVPLVQPSAASQRAWTRYQ